MDTSATVAKENLNEDNRPKLRAKFKESVKKVIENNKKSHKAITMWKKAHMELIKLRVISQPEMK